MTSLRTARLELRPYEEADIQGLHRLWTNPGVRKYLWDDHIIPVETVAEVVTASQQDWATHGYGQWAIRRQQEPEVIGCCGFRSSTEDENPELLYGLLPPYWGKGLATEAGQAALHYIFTAQRLPRIWAATDPPNVASIRVVERLGMHFDRRGILNGLDALFYSLSREQWQRQLR